MIIILILSMFFFLASLFFLILDVKIYQKLQELKSENERLQCNYFNETLSSNMKEEVVKKQYVDNDSGPVKWIKRDIEN